MPLKQSFAVKQVRANTDLLGGILTWIGVGQLMVSIILRAMGYHDIANIVTGTGGATAAVGLGRKFEKSKH